MPYGKSDYKIIDVTPTLATSEYANRDALFNYTEIPNAVIGNGGCSKLLNITVNSKKASSTGMEIYLFGSPQSLESANTLINITAAEGAAANFLGYAEIPVFKDLGDFCTGLPFAQKSDTADTDVAKLPFLLQAQDDSTSVYFIAKITGAVTYAADDLTFRFHLQYR